MRKIEEYSVKHSAYKIAFATKIIVYINWIYYPKRIERFFSAVCDLSQNFEEKSRIDGERVGIYSKEIIEIEVEWDIVAKYVVSKLIRLKFQWNCAGSNNYSRHNPLSANEQYPVERKKNRKIFKTKQQQQQKRI